MTTLLHFLVEGIACAIPNEHALFVVQMVAFAQPAIPARGVAGKVNIEGSIYPVYSIRQLLGFSERSPRPSDVLIIAEAGPVTVALWVDETSDIMDSSAHVDAESSSELTGLHITSDGVVIIDDLPLFLLKSDPEKIRTALPSPCKESAVETEYPERVQSILEKRARKIARPVGAEDQAVPVEILKFRLAYQEYAFSMEYIREVVLTGEITPVPGTPKYIAGICAIRGEIISLVDLREFFKIREKGLTDLNRVIVITDGTITFGILADFITGIGAIRKEMLSPVRQGQTQISEHYTLGAVNDLIVLDVAALLKDPAMVVSSTAMERPISN